MPDPDDLDLDDRVEAIRSRMDLAAFVLDLIDDLRVNPEKWENLTLESYLDGLSRWIEDMEGYHRSRGEVMPQEPSWSRFGEILLAAKV